MTNRVLEMRNAIDMIEGALMGFGDLIDLPELFEGQRDDLQLALRVNVGEMRRVCTALAECTRIINDPAYAPDQFTLCEDEGCPHAGTPHVCIGETKPWIYQGD